MDYFKLFDLPRGFDVDQKALTKAYYRLSKEYHPDNFTLASADEQASALSTTSDINTGYKILKNKQQRLKYVLQLLGVDFQEGKESMPQEFLMEMMDLNEAIMDYKMDPSPDVRSKIESQVATFQTDIESQVQENMAALKMDAPQQEQLTAIKSYYLKSKYLKRLLDNLDDKGVEM
jgi:molecular chaperone HscB